MRVQLHHGKSRFQSKDINKVGSLAAGMSVEQVAHHFGIGKTTVYEVAKRQPELLERYKQGKAKRIAQYVSIVHDKILGGNMEFSSTGLKILPYCDRIHCRLRKLL